VQLDLAGLRGQLEKIVGADHVGVGPTATGKFSVDGVVPGLLVRPGTQDEVSKALAACAGANAAVIPWGGGTAMGLGNRPRRADVVLLLDRLDQIVEFDAANLCVTVEAGAKLAGLQAALAQKKEILPLDPPADAKVTAGGLVATNLSGPSRLLYGTARDWVLGMRVAMPDGERVHCGGKVIKNVSGYDMNKLFIGSFGTLGIITEVTFKLLPLPATRAGVVGLFPDLAQAADVVRKTLESVLLPEALELLDPEAVTLVAPRLGLEVQPGAYGLAVALAGSRETVERQVRDFSSLFRDAGGRVTPLPEGRTVLAWDAIRNVFGYLPAPPSTRVLCKIAVPISRTGDLFAAAGVLRKRHGLPGALTAHAGSGIVWACYLVGPKAPPEEVLADALEGLRSETEQAEGSLVVQDAPATLKARVDVWGKPRDGFEVMKRLKAEFDPRGVCNPGRFLGGL
jgi:glycolate dehydrogenase FAD-binding subunit